MKNTSKHITLALILLTPYLVFSQQGEFKNDIIQQRIEFIAQQYESSNIDFTNLIEVLTFYFNHPLNLNTTNQEELESLNLLTSFQIRAILNYRSLNGDFLTIYELRNINELDPITSQNIIPFVIVAPSTQPDKFNIKRTLKFGRNEIISLWGKVLEQQEGYLPTDSTSGINSRYLGNSNRIYFRYRFLYNNYLSFGVTADKDPGEELFEGNNPKGFDFLSAHFFAQNIGVVKQLAIGDFHAQFGQGLTLWTGFSFRKTADALNVVRYARKLSPYASRNENNFLRGIGTTIQMNNIELTAFYSKKSIDANISQHDTLNTEEQIFTSLQESGLHRTPSEISNKHAITEQITGANIEYRNHSFKVGGRIIHSQYNALFERKPQLYQKFLLDTNQWYNAGLDVNILLNNINLFGELSLSNNGGHAYLAGALLHLDDQLSLTILQRNFQPNYLSVYANSFGERADNNNENGTYLGLKAGLLPGLILTGYIDRYNFQWLSYQADGPTQGLDYMLRIHWFINQNLNIYTRYRKETQQKNAKSSTPIQSLTNVSRSYLRFHITYTPSTKLKLNSRAEWSTSNYPNAEDGRGFVLYQDVQYKFMDFKSTLTGRVALFDVDDYNARIYAYENDVLYYFSVPAFYKRGLRTFLVYHYKVSRHFELWAKLSRTFLSHETTFGSGTEMINEPRKTEVRVQVRFTL